MYRVTLSESTKPDTQVILFKSTSLRQASVKFMDYRNWYEISYGRAVQGYTIKLESYNKAKKTATVYHAATFPKISGELIHAINKVN